MNKSTFSICNHCNQVNRVSLDSGDTKVAVCGKCHKPLSFHNGLTDIASSESLQKLSQKISIPIIADFWAPWCQPCLRFAPVFQAGALQLAGKAVLVKINTEDHPETGSFFKVRGIPTLIILNNGKEQARTSGSMPSQQFLDWVNTTIS